MRQVDLAKAKMDSIEAETKKRKVALEEAIHNQHLYEVGITNGTTGSPAKRQKQVSEDSIEDFFIDNDATEGGRVDGVLAMEQQSAVTNDNEPVELSGDESSDSSSDVEE